MVRGAPLSGEGWYDDVEFEDSTPWDERGTVRGPATAWQASWTSLAEGLPPTTRVAAEQGFVLTPANLAGLGISRSTARTLVRRGRWQQVGRGLVSPVEVTGDAFEVRRRRHALAAAGASLSHPGQAVCARSAAILQGLPTLGVPALPELAAPVPHGLGRRATHAFGASWRPADTSTWFGIPLLHPARTIADLARHDRRDGLMAMDAALRESLVTRAAVERALDGQHGWPGIRQARSVLALADARAESALESLVRLHCHDAGLPPPRLQLWIEGFRVDLCWPEVRLIVEADGRSKYTGDALWAEKRREDTLRSRSWVFERIVWADLFGGWPATERRLRRHF